MYCGSLLSTLLNTSDIKTPWLAYSVIYSILKKNVSQNLTSGQRHYQKFTPIVQLANSPNITRAPSQVTLFFWRGEGVGAWERLFFLPAWTNAGRVWEEGEVNITLERKSTNKITRQFFSRLSTCACLASRVSRALATHFLRTRLTLISYPFTWNAKKRGNNACSQSEDLGIWLMRRKSAAGYFKVSFLISRLENKECWNSKPE